MANIVIDARVISESTGRYVERLLHYLQQLESEHQFTVLLKPKDMAGWTPSNKRFSKMKCPYKEFTFAEQIGFLQQLNKLRTEGRADLVHFGMVQQPILYAGATVTTMHDLTTLRFSNPDKQALVFKLKQNVYGVVNKRAARHAGAVITPTEFVRQDVLQYTHVSPNKIHVTHEAADVITTPPTPLEDLQKTKFIMYVGRPTPHKNLPRLIEAFALLRSRHPDLVLVLAGKKDANYEQIVTKAPGGVHFTGFVTDGELRWLYEHCQAYVFPSLSEGFGLPGLEAMVHGAPVVSSNATCLPEVYGDAAHYFDPTDVPAIADAIDEVLTDKQLRTDLIAAGRLKAQDYSWRRMAEQTLAIYDEALLT